MKNKFGIASGLFVVGAVTFALIAMAPAAQAGSPPNDNGDRDMLRDREQDQTSRYVDPSLLHLRIRDRDHDRDGQSLLPLSPPQEDGDDDPAQNQIRERYRHQWQHYTGLTMLLDWLGF